MTHNGRTITANSKKAEVFLGHYKAVNKLNFNKEDRALNRECKKQLAAVGPGEECCSEFTIKELDKARDQMRANGAAGPDDIAPRFLKSLGPIARGKLLQLMNLSFWTGDCPQGWMNATIIPLLKAGKPPGRLDSYRPVSLTSCIAKTMERMVANRLSFLAEKNGWISPRQAGFRSDHCCEDQVIRLSQGISDGLQNSPMKRTVLGLLDFSKAYDKVWRQELLLTMLSKGVPLQFCKWIAAFLRNRQACVQFNGEQCRMRSLSQGVPQGSVLAPHLFVFFINGITDQVPEDVEMALYADDVAIWSSDRNKEVATARIQDALNSISDWCSKKKMLINAEKSEVAIFSTSSGDASWRPDLWLNGQRMPFNATPKFLGVTMDRCLSFNNHVELTVKKATAKSRVLAALSSREWGWSIDSLRSVFLSLVRSILDYAAAGWQPWLSESSLAALDRAQNAALRLLTGQLRSSPLEALRAQVGLPSYQTHSRRLCAIAYEKALRLPETHPRRIAMSGAVRERLKRNNLRRIASGTVNSLQLNDYQRAPIRQPNDIPWQDTWSNWEVSIDLEGLTKESSPAELKDTAIRIISRAMAQLTIYTDGSASEGTMLGGAAAVITSGAPTEPVVHEELMAAGRAFTSSFEEELAALHLAADWLLANRPLSCLICSDSQSALQALKHGNKDSTDLRQKFYESHVVLKLQWIPGHCEIPGNELADAAAKRASIGPEDSRPAVSFSAAKALIKRDVTDPAISHERSKKAYEGFSWKREAALGLSRSESVLLSQLRAGHCMLLAAYRQLIDPSTNPLCPQCGESPQTVEHWLVECPAIELQRRAIFNTNTTTLTMLSTHPSGVVLLARKSLGLRGSAL
jgi:ribonuclease HI